LVYRLTHSEVLLGVAAFCGQIPVFLLSVVGGVVADRAPRRPVLIATQSTAMLLAFVLGALTLTGWVEVWHVLVLATLLGVTNAFDIPVRQSFVMDMVGGREDLAAAIALNSSIVNSARVIGPAIAGVLVAIVGEGWCFVLNGVSYLGVIAALAVMKVPPTKAHEGHASAWSDIRRGIEFAWRAAPIRGLLLLVGVASLLGLPFTPLMPVFAHEILGGGPRTLGLLVGSTGAGALAGALLLARRGSARGLASWIAGAGISFGAAAVLFAASRVVWLSSIAMAAVGFSMVLQNAGTNTLLQTLSPDHLRGRVMSLFALVFVGMAPIGALIASGIAWLTSTPTSVMICGTFAAVSGVSFALRLRGMRARTVTLVADGTLAAGSEP
jgi:MFS family permease